MKVSSAGLVCVWMLGVPSVAWAQGAPSSTARGQQAAPTRPTLAPVDVSSAVRRYIVGPSGHVRGFVLATGAVVWLSAADGDALAAAVPVGQGVRVQGYLRAVGEATPVIYRATVTSGDGHVNIMPAGFHPGGAHGLEDHAAAAGGMGGEDEDVVPQPTTLATASANGTVETVVPGRLGVVRALLLSNNTTVFIPRSLSEALTAHGVRPGQSLRASGRGGSYRRGASVFATTLNLSDGTNLTAPPPPAH